MLLDFKTDEELLSFKWKLMAKDDKKLFPVINKILGERWKKLRRRRKQKSLAELLEG